MSSKSLRRVLLGLEATAGTYVNPTYPLRAKASFKPVVDKVVVEEDIGSFAPARHYIGSQHAEGTLEMEAAYYEEAHHLVQMATGAGVRTGTPGAYTYAMTLPDDAANDFRTYTVEYTDGASHVVMASDVFATGLEISGEAGQAWVVKNEIVGGNVTLPGGITANPTVIAATDILMADTSLYIDDTFANIGNTAVSVTLISFNWKLSNLQHQKQFAGSLYPAGRGNDRWEVTLEMVVEINSTTLTEYAKSLATTQSAVRIKADNGAGKTATIDGMYFVSEPDTLDDRDGNNILKLTYMGEKDSSNNTPVITIVGGAN